MDEKQKDRCPCGGVILADTEDWPTPLCYECAETPLKETDGAMPLELVDRSRQLIKEGYQKEIAELERKYAWLIQHSWVCAAISKAKAAELLGCSLIDFDEKISQANEELDNG